MSEAINWVNTFSNGGKLSVIWFGFILIIIFYLSITLVKYSTALTQKTKLGGAFIGGVMIAIITSTPELITEITQAVDGSPEQGFADDLGSNFFSIFMIAVISIIFVKKAKILNMASKWTKITIYNSAIISFIAFLGSIINNDIVIGKMGTFAFGIWPLILFIAFIAFIIIQYFVDAPDEPPVFDVSHISKMKAIIMFIIIGLSVIAASVLLNIIVNSMQIGYEISHDSAGGIILAITTSLPEVVVFILLNKNKQYELGVAAITGSHAFNLGITLIGDMIYTQDASFNTDGIGSLWPLALLTFISLVFLIIHLNFSKKLIKTSYYLVIPILVVMTYIGGWGIIILL